MNRAESEANNRAVDSLINYETVKYFGNESHEAKRYDECMQKYQVCVDEVETRGGGGVHVHSGQGCSVFARLPGHRHITNRCNSSCAPGMAPQSVVLLVLPTSCRRLASRRSIR
jgi:hypothetical protein